MSCQSEAAKGFGADHFCADVDDAQAGGNIRYICVNDVTATDLSDADPSSADYLASCRAWWAI